MNALIGLAESGVVPDGLTRLGIRRLLRARLRHEAVRECGGRGADALRYLGATGNAPIAVHAESANAQHYELPPEFFRLMLGPHMKYSSGFWPGDVQDLAQAEARMLSLSCERAGIRDGMRVLDLGCGWGSLSLWIARRYPECRVTAVSNSASQRRHIEQQARAQGLERLEVITADVSRFEPAGRFDRIVSVEMFEHVRNYPVLMARIKRWLAPQGALFVHIFCHDRYTYPFETNGDTDWMARYFFTGGTMPAADLLPRVQDHLELAQSWDVNGVHYARTLQAWLRRLDANRGPAMAILARHYGEAEAPRWLERWRLFLLACAELFGYGGGRQWYVKHYLFVTRDA